MKPMKFDSEKIQNMSHQHATADNQVPGTMPVPAAYAAELQRRVAFILDLQGPGGGRWGFFSIHLHGI